MSKEIIPSKNREILKNQDLDESVAFFKKTVSNVTKVFFEPYGADGIYREFKEAVKSLREAKNKKEEEGANKKLSKLSQEAVSLMCYPWGELSFWPVDKENTDILKKMRNSLVDEYCPKTPTELSLIDIIATAYYNFMRNSRILNFHLMKKDEDEEDKVFVSYDPNTMKAAKEASKAVDLAYRQFTNSIILLKEIRQPKLNIHVKTENAYLAKNQQVINVKKSNSRKEKIINNR
ncbi:MAG: hypothetical protein PHI53_03230 [Candidatus Pacebacteria bacterium]|nr:hypothetical protein [Candidatus Paceibacterota bacterium]